MGSRLIIEGNAVYEIDEDCLRLQKEKMEQERRVFGEEREGGAKNRKNIENVQDMER